MSLEFYPDSHRYRLDGPWVPGVTTQLNGGLPKKQLMYWSARTVAEYVADHPEDVDALRRMGRGPMVQALKETPWQARDTAAVRGTDVHALAEQLAQHEQVDVPEHLDGYVQSCVQFLDEWRPTTLLTERQVAHRAHWWAGTFDLIVRLPDGRIILIDWKTNASGVFPETALQLAAYRHAEFYVADDGTEQPMPPIDDTWVVWLRPDEYQVIPVKGDAEAYKTFRHVSYVANAAKRMQGNKTEPGWVGAPLTAPNTEEVA